MNCRLSPSSRRVLRKYFPFVHPAHPHCFLPSLRFLGQIHYQLWYPDLYPDLDRQDHSLSVDTQVLSLISQDACLTASSRGDQRKIPRTGPGIRTPESGYGSLYPCRSEPDERLLADVAPNADPDCPLHVLPVGHRVAARELPLGAGLVYV